MCRFLLLYCWAFLLPLGAHAKSILIIGDSQSCGPFGSELVRQIKKAGLDQVTLVGHWGASATTWMNHGQKAPVLKTITSTGHQSLKTNVIAPTLESMLIKTSPDAVIVELGGNLVEQDPSKARSSVRQLMRKIVASGAECYWIGPSNGRRPEKEFARLHAILFEVARDEHCRFVDSRPYTSYPRGRGDGLHYQYLGQEGERLAAKWVKGVWSEISFSWRLDEVLPRNPGIAKPPADKTAVYQGVNQKFIYPASNAPGPRVILDSQGLGR